MPGGLLNLVSEGNMNRILNGNPKKTFFRATYSKYTNFGLQKFRLDFEGLRILRLTEDSEFSFKVPRYADMFMDTYFVVTLPNIWSPIVEMVPPLPVDVDLEGEENAKGMVTRNFWPYEFKWIDNLGAQMIRTIRYRIGGTVIQEMSGQYLYSMVQRDFSETKKKLFDEMTGNTKQLNDPANFAGRNGNYPNVIYNKEWNRSEDGVGGAEPSIRGRKIYIPLNVWSTLSSKVSIPLVALQYEFLTIEVVCRPIQELFVVRYIPPMGGNWLEDNTDIAKTYNEIMIRIANNKLNKEDFNDPDDLETKINLINDVGTYVQPNQVFERYALYRFLHEPVSPTVYEDPEDNINSREKNGTISGTDIDPYLSKNNNFASDIHLISTYAFLSEEERRTFAEMPQSYLIKDIQETTFYNRTGSNIIRLPNSNGLVASWMWFFQRSDVNLRNQWSNYTNWATESLPFKGVANFMEAYAKPYIPEFFYNFCSNVLTANNNPASWENVSLNNFGYFFFSASGNSFNADLLNENNIEFEKLPDYWTRKLELSGSGTNIIGTDENKNEMARILGLGEYREPVGNFKDLPRPFLVTGPLHVENQKEIMMSWGLLLNGKIRESVQDAGVFNYIEKYVRTPGNGKSGLYCYNFCLDTDPFKYQPTGAINLTKFNEIEFEFTTIFPPQRSNDIIGTEILDSCGNVIGINKPTWRIFEYNYNLHVMEERYNVLYFNSGMAGLMFSR